MKNNKYSIILEILVLSVYCVLVFCDSFWIKDVPGKELITTNNALDESRPSASK